MQMMKTMIWFLGLWLIVAQSVQAQSNASFKKEIDAFVQKDAEQMPPKDAILFVGSSSFRKWTDVDKYFPGYTIINRGFGGSQLSNLIFYADKIIYPYQPKQVIIYCGENDFDYDRSVSADTVFERFHTLFNNIRHHLPNTTIGFVSIKFSPSRTYAWDKVKKTNSLVMKFLKKQKNAAYIDITKDMFDADGKAITTIYEADQLHLKPAGYKIWQKHIQPYLLK